VLFTIGWRVSARWLGVAWRERGAAAGRKCDAKLIVPAGQACWPRAQTSGEKEVSVLLLPNSTPFSTSKPPKNGTAGVPPRDFIRLMIDRRKEEKA